MKVQAESFHLNGQKTPSPSLALKGLKQSFSFFEDLTGWPCEKSLCLFYALERELKQPPKARGIPAV